MKDAFLQLFAIGISAKDNGVADIKAEVLIPNILGVVYWAAGVTAVVAIILGGLFYILADGNAQKITRAKDIILYGVVGLVVVLLAFVVTNFVVGWFA